MTFHDGYIYWHFIAVYIGGTFELVAVSWLGHIPPPLASVRIEFVFASCESSPYLSCRIPDGILWYMCVSMCYEAPLCFPLTPDPLTPQALQIVLAGPGLWGLPTNAFQAPTSEEMRLP